MAVLNQTIMKFVSITEGKKERKKKKSSIIILTSM